MDYYCQRCGRIIGETERVCPACGVSQDRFKADEEQKACKKCQQEIPVNSNYCYHCGADQAQYYYQSESLKKETPQVEKEEQPDQENIFKQIFEGDYDDLNASYQRILKAEEEQRAELQKLKGKVTRANENEKPGLIPSTKLYLKDWFNINKRMGRADFWWSFVGMIGLTFVFSLVLSVVVTGLRSVEPNFANFFLNFMVRVFIGFILIANMSALIRRFRDAEIPVIAIVMVFIPVVGEIAAYILATKKQVVTNDDYTFIDPVREVKKRRKARKK